MNGARDNERRSRHGQEGVAEHDDDVAQCHVFQARIEEREGDTSGADDKQRPACESHECQTSDNGYRVENKRQTAVFLYRELPVDKSVNAKGVLGIYALAIIGDVAPHVACRVHEDNVNQCPQGEPPVNLDTMRPRPRYGDYDGHRRCWERPRTCGQNPILE